MSILIVGGQGSMGRRYQAILSYLGRPFHAVDRESSGERIRELAEKSTGVIIASPTDTHVDFIREFSNLRKPILCEKPVTKNIEHLHEVLDLVEKNKTPFRMMYQYQMLVDRSRLGKSFYDYFRHGNDGLIWDCLQIIGLARGEVQLREVSPVWSCVVNGQKLNLQHMDAAYIAYVQRWFRDPDQNQNEIIRAHERCAESEAKWRK
jgi:hypothetical protein